MMLQRLSVMAFLILLFSLLAIQTASGYRAEETPDLTSLSDADLKAVTVNFERTRCYGTCAAYAVTIHGDGHVEYLGKDHVKMSGKQERHVETATIRALMSEFARAKFVAMAGDYSQEKCTCGYCTDMPSVFTELTAKSVTHRVNHYYGCGCAPKALSELELAIDKLVNSEQWDRRPEQNRTFRNNLL
jgi:Domain of unknown function (DUF6438)